MMFNAVTTQMLQLTPGILAESVQLVIKSQLMRHLNNNYVSVKTGDKDMSTV